MINNTSPTTAGWFWTSISTILKTFANAHPYVIYSLSVATAGGLFYYYIGWPLITGSLNTLVAKPVLTVRLIQNTSNLQAESKQDPASN